MRSLNLLPFVVPATACVAKMGEMRLGQCWKRGYRSQLQSVIEFVETVLEASTAANGSEPVWQVWLKENMNSSTATLSKPSFSERALRAEVARLRSQNARLQEKADRLVAQVDAAAVIQRQLTPPASLELHGANIDVYCWPVSEVSGDMYDIVRLDEVTTAIIVLDVAGHGLAAGMLAVVLKQRLLDEISNSQQAGKLDPGDLLSQLNESLIDMQLPDCQFATAIVAIFDESSGLLRVARAGAPYPILSQQCEATAIPLQGEGGLVGVLSNASFETVEVQLAPGDAVYFWTDGVETLLDESEQYALCQPASCPGKLNDGQLSSRHRLFDAVTRRTKTAISPGCELDDTTIVVLERTGTCPSELGSPSPSLESNRQVLQCNA